MEFSPKTTWKAKPTYFRKHRRPERKKQAKNGKLGSCWNGEANELINQVIMRFCKSTVQFASHLSFISSPNA